MSINTIIMDNDKELTKLDPEGIARLPDESCNILLVQEKKWTDYKILKIHRVINNTICIARVQHTVTEAVRLIEIDLKNWSTDQSKENAWYIPILSEEYLKKREQRRNKYINRYYGKSYAVTHDIDDGDFDYPIETVKKQKIQDVSNNEENKPKTEIPITLNFESLINKRMEEIEEKLNIKASIVASSSEEIPNVVGVWTQKQHNNFSQLSKSHMKQFLGNKKVSVKNDLDEHNKRSMCAYYKNPEVECKSKKLILRSDGMQIYTSGNGIYVHKKIFGVKSLRLLAASDAKKELFKYAICSNCKNNYSNNDDMINVKDQNKNCILCKKNASDVLKGSNFFNFCRQCAKSHAQMDRDANQFIGATLHIVKEIFNDIINYEELYDQTVSVGNKSKKKHKHYKPDIVMKGMKSGLKFMIVIESDPLQHSSSNASMDDDYVKMIKQTYSLNENQNFNRIFMIRFNHNGNYMSSSFPIKYDRIERLIILRQWIIWWLQNLPDMRRILHFYMFYSEDKFIQSKKPLVFSTSLKLEALKWEGMSMIYARPDPGVNEWQYAVIPSEAQQNSFSRINAHHMNSKTLREINKAFVWKQEQVSTDLPYKWGL